MGFFTSCFGFVKLIGKEIILTQQVYKVYIRIQQGAETDEYKYTLDSKYVKRKVRRRRKAFFFP